MRGARLWRGPVLGMLLWLLAWPCAVGQEPAAPAVRVENAGSRIDSPFASLPDPPVVEYAIRVRLDADAKRLHASQVLRYTNHSPDRIPDLQFHLYLNAFKNQRSTFWRESGGQLRSDRASKANWGYIDLSALRIDGADKLADFEYIQPDGTDPEDQTVGRVPLDTPLEPGATLVIEFEFEAQLPHVFARTGFHNKYFLVGQWFPKIGVWESAGDRYATEAGWNCHQFHANSEFYADFGRYEVEITVPAKFKVGATGVRTAVRSEGASTVYTYVQDHVIDFAFTASPNFIELEQTFKASEWVTEDELNEIALIHGIPVEEARLRDVTMKLLLQPDHGDMKDRYFTALANGLKYFGLWYGAYPYDTITLVDPPPGGRGSGGMEYPTFITGGTSRKAPEDATGVVPYSMSGPEAVTVHEFGHQYWQSMAASNEFEEAWLDEGFNSYSTGLIMDLVYGSGPLYRSVNQIPLPVGKWLGIGAESHGGTARTGTMMNRDTDAIVRNAWSFRNGMSYGMNSYPKTEAVLRQLQIELGDAVMARVMRTYFQRWRFRHPTTRDFIETVEAVSGEALDWFFDQLVLGPGFVDYAVDAAYSTELGDELGVFDAPDGRVVVDEAAIEARHAQDDETEDDESGTRHRTTVVIRNRGNVQYPVEIAIRFSDGEEVREQWDGAYTWVRFTYEREAELDRVVIDPDNRLILDVNRANNSYVADPPPDAMIAWTLKFLLWVQSALEGVAGALL